MSSTSHLHVGSSATAGAALAQAHEHLQALRRTAEQHDALSLRLTNFTDEPRHEAMIPLGPYAAMPGQLVNTNSILVPLGDGYQVEYSAKQAREVAMRRWQDIGRQMEEMSRQVETLTAQVAEEAHSEPNMTVNEEGELLNEEGLPFTDINEVDTAALGDDAELQHRHAEDTLVPAPRHPDHSRIAQLFAEAEAEENQWLEQQIEDGHADDLIEQGLLPASPLPSPSTPKAAAPLPPVHPSPRPPSPPSKPAQPERRPSSSAKKVAFDLPPETETPKAFTSTSSSTTPSRPMKDAVIENPPSAKALGKQPAKQPSLADKVLIKEVIERPPKPTRSESDTESIDDEEGEEGEETDETSEGSNFDYSDDEELEEFSDRLEEAMMHREAAMAFHALRPEHALRAEHDPALADDEMADEEGNVWHISGVGQQSRFRGGANQTASLIIPALQVPREDEEPTPGGTDFHLDNPAYTAEERETIRKNLLRLEQGLPMDAASSNAPPTEAIDAREAEVASKPSVAPPVTHEVQERTSSTTPKAPVAPSAGEGPKKMSRFRTRNAV